MHDEVNGTIHSEHPHVEGYVIVACIVPILAGIGLRIELTTVVIIYHHRSGISHTETILLGNTTLSAVFR